MLLDHVVLPLDLAIQVGADDLGPVIDVPEAVLLHPRGGGDALAGSVVRLVEQLGVCCQRELPSDAFRQSMTPRSPLTFGSRGRSLLVPMKMRSPARTGPP